MKYIIAENGQIIKVRGRKFYYPPKDKWIEDKYLSSWPLEKLRRLGVYKYKEESYNSDYYKPIGYNTLFNDITMVATRTFDLVPKKDPTYWRNQKRKQYKREGITLFKNAIQMEPVLEFSGDTPDLTTYKENVKSAFVTARQELRAILEDTTLTDIEKYEAIQSHEVVWPEPPLSEEDMSDYGL